MSEQGAHVRRRAFIDIQALQSPTSAGRGIGRYVTELGRALARCDAPVAAFALSPAAPVPEAFHRDLHESGLVAWNTARVFDAERASSPLSYLIASPFEGVSPVDTLLPPYVADADVPLVAILYDLVPLVLGDEYLADPTVRRSYEQRLDVLRRADLLLAISEHARRDAIELLEIDAERVVTIGAGASPFFRPAVAHDRAPELMHSGFGGITRPFVLCVTATDPRKNTELLLDAWGRTPTANRDAYQLVLAGRVDDDALRRWGSQALDAGLRDDDVLVVGSVTDEELRTLYQMARLVAVPSRYEGFGLPVLEAARCGTPAVVADAGASPEILECVESTFPPDDADAAAARLTDALADGPLRTRIIEAAGRAAATHTWEAVAARTVMALDDLDTRRRTRWTDHRSGGTRVAAPPRVGVVGVLPPTRAATAEYHQRIADDLGGRCRLDWFAPEADGRAPTGRPRSWRRFSTGDLGRTVAPSRYDAMIYALGADPGTDAEIVELARLVPGTLWLHDPGAAPPDVLATASAIVVEREYDVAAVALHAGPFATLPPISVLPVVGTPTEDTPTDDTPTDDTLVIVAIGGARAGRGGDTLLETLGYLAPQVSTRLVFAEPTDPDIRDALRARADELGVRDRLHFEHSTRLTDATCVVLLGPPDGNDAVVLANVLADGIPVVTDHSPPFGAGATWVVDVDTDAAALSTQLLALARSPSDLAERRAAGQAHTVAWSLEDVSRHLLTSIGVDDPRVTTPTDDPEVGPIHVARWARPRSAPAEPTTRRQLADLATLLETPLVVVDVGCRWGFAEAWTELGPAARLYGFEPDTAECGRVAEMYHDRPEITVVPRALGASRGVANLHLTREPACASVYAPGPATLRHPAMAPMRLASVQPVQLETLDEWAGTAGVPRVDVLKADTQGSELDVLAGAEETLRHVRALEIEVEFNPIYDHQPLFGDVDQFLRDRGFVLWRLRHLVHYGQEGTSPGTRIDDVQFFDDAGVGFATGGGQLFWGMAYYVSAEVANPALVDDWRVLVRDACVLTALDIPDLAGIALSRANALAPTPEAVVRRDLDTG